MECKRSRINLFLLDFDRLYNFLSSKSKSNDGLWETLNSCKYIVSTVKAIHLFDNYYLGDEIEKNNILWELQSVISGKKTLETALDVLDITYKNSLNERHVMNLIYGIKTP